MNTHNYIKEEKYLSSWAAKWETVIETTFEVVVDIGFQANPTDSHIVFSNQTSLKYPIRKKYDLFTIF